jgi:SOS-response transcriptional repressor LexA
MTPQAPAYTTKQVEIMEFLRGYIELYDRAPTLSEIAEGMDISPQTAHGHIMRLVRIGAISSRTHQARSITIRDEDYKPETSNEAKIRRMAQRDPDFRQFIVELAKELSA